MVSNLTVVAGRPVFQAGADTHRVAQVRGRLFLLAPTDPAFHWQATEPDYEPNTVLHETELVELSDGDYWYTPVVVVGSPREQEGSDPLGLGSAFYAAFTPTAPALVGYGAIMGAGNTNVPVTLGQRATGGMLARVEWPDGEPTDWTLQAAVIQRNSGGTLLDWNLGGDVTSLGDGWYWVTQSIIVGADTAYVQNAGRVDMAPPLKPVTIYGTASIILTGDDGSIPGRLDITDYFDGTTAETVDAASNTILRSDDDGLSWVTVAEGVAANGSVADWTVPVAHDAVYRVQAVSALPSVAVGEAVLTVPSDAGFLSGGAGFETVAAIRVNLGGPPTYDISEGLAERILTQYEGRLLPVEHSGAARARSGKVTWAIPPDELNTVRALAYLPGPFLLRTPHGDTLYCSISSVDRSPGAGGWWQIGITVTEVEQ